MEGWRHHLSRLNYSKHTDVYEFGVFTGRSVNWINESFAAAEKTVRKIFGFDSFCGLPKEADEEKELSASREFQWKLIDEFQWSFGDFNSQEHFDVTSVQEAMNSLRTFVEPTLENGAVLELIPGYFSDSLTDDIVEKYDMRPACYVDLDADLYSSTTQALDFLFRNKLIQQNTILGYDDWGGSPGWQTMEDGVSKAHLEIADKYNVDLQLIALTGAGYPHIQTIFEVRSIG